jgi:GNAT superfamily N-acetyltransferase
LSRERALELQQRGIRDWIALLGASSEGASLVRRGGVTASVCPACPQRSICSSVTYTDAGELAATLDELAAIYDAAGIAAWTVWVPEFDREAIAALEAAGHELDAAPVAMSLELAGFEPPEVGDLDWDNDVDPADLGRLNDLAYDLPPESLLSPALTAPPANPDLRLYQARIGGRPACVLGTIDHHRQAPQQRRGSATPPSDLGVYFVATDPDHRGLGLASRLMTVALGEAIERGLETSSLQGSIMGQSVYRRLGYSDDFTLTMRERRR